MCRDNKQSMSKSNIFEVDLIGVGYKNNVDDTALFYKFKSKLEQIFTITKCSVKTVADKYSAFELEEISEEIIEEMSVPIEAKILIEVMEGVTCSLVFEKAVFIDTTIKLKLMFSAQDIKIETIKKICDKKINIINCLEKYCREVYYLFDGISFFLSNELYPIVYRIENRFRLNIIDYMCKKRGQNWFKTYIVKEIQKSRDKHEGWYKGKFCTNDINLICDLHNIMTSDLIKMFKSSYSEKTFNDINDKTENFKEKLTALAPLLKDNVDLSTIWENELRNMLVENFDVSWENFSLIRNQIAHNKIINASFYDYAIVECEKMNKDIDVFESNINNSLFSQEKRDYNKYIRDSYGDYYRDLYNEDYGGTYGTIHSNDEGYIEDIKRDKLVTEVFEKISEYVDEYKGFIEERYENWKDIKDEINSLSFDQENRDILFSMFKKIYNINISEDNDDDNIHGMIDEELKKIVNHYTNLKMEYNEDWKYSTDNDDWLIELNYNENKYILKSRIDVGMQCGIFYIEHNGMEMSRVNFGISLPEFETTDYGGVKPYSEFSVDLYDVAIYELLNEFFEFFKSIKIYYENLDEIYDGLSSLVYEQ